MQHRTRPLTTRAARLAAASALAVLALSGGTAGATPTPTPTPAPPAPPRCAADNVRWAGSSNTLYLTGPVACTLTELDKLVPKAPLDQPSPGVWTLGSNLRLGDGARLDLNGPDVGGDVRQLRLRSDGGGIVWVRAQWGTISLRRTSVTSWDAAANRPDTNAEDKRAFMHVRSYLDADGKTARQSRMDIVDSDVGFLGYHAAESYGLVWKVSGTPNPALFAKVDVLGDVTGSRLHDNWFGAYTYGANGMRWERNEIDHNAAYGLDPHDDSDALVIRDNYAHHNGAHGIICSQRCDHLVIERNRAIANGGHGIMLHRGVTASRVVGNEAASNADTGIALFESHDNLVEGNRVTGNLRGIRLSLGSARNVIRNNTVTGNTGHGLYFFKGSDTPTSGDGRPRGNRLAGNTVTGNGSALRLDDADDNVFTGNDFSGNAEGLVLRGGTGNRVEQVTDGAVVETYGRGGAVVETTLSGVRTVTVRQGDGARTVLADPRGQVFATEEQLSTTVTRAGSRLAMETGAIGGRSSVTGRQLWVQPAAGTVTVSPRGWSATGELLREWVATASAASQQRTWTLGGLPSGMAVTVIRDGKALATLTATGGTLRFADAPPDTAQHAYRVVPANSAATG
jgi:parallel beta-helix repeat protein